MEEPKLHISPKKYNGESTVVSVRMPKDMVADLDRIAEITGRTRNEIMTLCLEFAIAHMEVTEQETQRKTENT